jgi:rSAM/selenodomain-associated transferase 1
MKAPQNGLSKTRLSPPLSAEEATDISRCFLKDTSAAIEELIRKDPFVVAVAVYTPVGSEADLGKFLPPRFKMLAQREADFGRRLSGAVEDLFSLGFSAVCLVNSDSPTLPFRNLQDLAALLKESTDRMVIGPCTDGGYYLLGLRRVHARLFEDIDWSTSRVYGQTIDRSKEINLQAIVLPAWYDVDDQFSLNRLLSELFPERAKERVPQGSRAPNTEQFLRQILVEEGAARIWPLAPASLHTA